MESYHPTAPIGASRPSRLVLLLDIERLVYYKRRGGVMVVTKIRSFPVNMSQSIPVQDLCITVAWGFVKTVSDHNVVYRACSD
jgi:hypothetical protein